MGENEESVNLNREMIRKIRETLSMTQPQLAEKIGVTRSTIACWEGGRTKVRLSPEQFMILFELIESMGVTVSDLLASIRQNRRP